MLATMIHNYHTTGRRGSPKPTDYYTEYPFLKEVDSNALTAETINLKTAYNQWFRHMKDGHGKPKFKSRHSDTHSYTSYTTKNNIRIEHNQLRMPKIGFINFKNYQNISWDNKTIKHATITMGRSGHFYASIMVEEEDCQQLPKTTFSIGIDLGLHQFCATSDGEIISNPKYFARSEEKLANLQRAFSRTHKESHRHEKLRQRIARLHEKIMHQREDFLHKLSTRLIRENQTIVVEDLDIKTIAQNRTTAKSTQDTAWRHFLNMLNYKARWYGRDVIKVSRWFPSSQLCHRCGYKNQAVKNLSVREWICPNCNEHHDRDVNAALNILSYGISAVGTTV